MRERAVIGARCRAHRVHACLRRGARAVLRASADAPLEIPANAVVVPGSRPLARGAFAEHELPRDALIVKYRDERTDLRAALEGDLR